METEHWCMQNVDYEQINFFPPPLPNRSRRAQDEKSSVHTGTICQSQALGGGCSVRVKTKEKAACCRLRDAILERRKNSQIAQTVAEWPSQTLRLCDVISTEHCQAALGSLDVLWTHIFHGLLIMTSQCQLMRLDLSHFIPTKGLLYTVLQLVPFLTLTADNLEKQTIFDMVIAKTDIEDEGLLSNLEMFLDNVLKHPVFHTQRKLRLPRGRLDIVLNCVPISADRLPFLCLLTAVAIQPISNVYFHINSIIFTYKEPGSEFVSTDPLLPLHLLKSVIKIWNLDGMAIMGIPDARSGEVLDHRRLQQFSGLSKLSVADCRLDLTNKATSTAKFCAALGKLRHLNRLDLSTSDLSQSLAAILNATERPLEYLSLSRCRLQTADLNALATSKHCTTLKDLDLSYIYADSCELINPTTSDAGGDRSATEASAWKTHPTKKDSGIYDDSSSTASVSTLSGADPGMYPRLLAECAHTNRDQGLFAALLSHLRLFVELVNLDISSHTFGFKLGRDLLLDLSNSLLQLSKLKQLLMQDVPLWDDCILLLIQCIVQLSQPQSVSVTRSVDAPPLNLHDKIAFWAKVDGLKGGRRLKLVITHFSEDSLFSNVPDSEDDSQSEYSSIGTYSETCSTRETSSPQSPRF